MAVHELSGADWALSNQKRSMDLLGIAGVLPVLLPVAGAAALAIKSVDSSNPWFTQTRYGLSLEPFTMYKLRTMPEDTLETPSLIGTPDPRATQLGNWLRRTHLDEIPQAVNVLRGTMSLVGVRPLIQADIHDTLDVLSSPEQRAWLASRAAVKPGITNRFSLLQAAISEPQLNAYDRAMNDIEYAHITSLAEDTRIILESSGMVLRDLLYAGNTPRGYRKGAKVLELTARSMGVGLSDEEKLYWKATFGAMRALDDIVDANPHQPSIEININNLIKGQPIAGLGRAHAEEFKDMYDALNENQKQLLRRVVMALPDFATARRAAQTLVDLVQVNTEEASEFAALLRLHDKEGESDNRYRFNRWLEHFAQAGYLIDLATDMPEDAASGVIQVAPNLLKRCWLMGQAVPEVVKAVRLTPPKVLVHLAAVALHNAVQNK